MVGTEVNHIITENNKVIAVEFQPPVPLKHKHLYNAPKKFETFAVSYFLNNIKEKNVRHMRADNKNSYPDWLIIAHNKLMFLECKCWKLPDSKHSLHNKVRNYFSSSNEQQIRQRNTILSLISEGTPVYMAINVYNSEGLNELVIISVSK